MTTLLHVLLKFCQWLPGVAPPMHSVTSAQCSIKVQFEQDDFITRLQIWARAFAPGRFASLRHNVVAASRGAM